MNIYMRKGSFGFTLIELLIVIALLGALAIGLLAALDPFEQLKKGTDTGTRNTMNEFHGSTIRFYAIKNYMPWCDDGSCSGPIDGKEPGGDPSADQLTDFPNTIAAIATTGELKSDFSELAGGQKDNIILTGTNDPPALTACFKPTSKSFMADPNTKYGPDGITPYTPAGGLCPNGVAGQCYYCIK